MNWRGPYVSEEELRHRIEWVTQRLDEVDDFADGVDWGTSIVDMCTLEELLGALTAALYLLEEVKD